MNNFLRWLVVGAFLGVGSSFVTSCTPACDAKSCATGCCDAMGACRTSDQTATACGAAGSTCRACSTGNVCVAGACQQAGAGGGSGGATGGGSGGAGGGATGGGIASGGGVGGGSMGGGAGGAGGGSGTGGGSSCGTLPILDAGTRTLTVTTGSCQMPTCGGPIQPGLYAYTAACSDDPLADAKQNCSGVTQKSGTSTLRGMVYFDACGNAEREIELSFNGTLNFPSSCATVGCQLLQVGIAMVFPGVACTSATGGGTGCDCTFAKTQRVTESGTYQADGGVLFFNPTNHSARRFAYCASGQTVTLREQGVSLTENGSSIITKQ